MLSGTVYHKVDNSVMNKITSKLHKSILIMTDKFKVELFIVTEEIIRGSRVIRFSIIVSQLLLMLSNLNSQETNIYVNCDQMSSWSVENNLFGRFWEFHNTDAYPGIWEQYIVNTSFEVWYEKGPGSPTPLKDNKPWLCFKDVSPTDGIAFPWEAYGGVISANFELYADDYFNSERSQRISCSTDSVAVGVKQKLALPDYRTGEYKVRLFAKTLGSNPQNFKIKLCDYASGTCFDSLLFSVSPNWQEFVGTLQLNGIQATQRHIDRHGIFYLIVSFDGRGDILLDQVTLFPTDAVEGVFNSETIANLKNIGVTIIRWPGGNFASGYHWQDGIGPQDQRVSVPNLAWGGLEPNHLGINEFLRFCELTGITPLICIGFDYASVNEAAAWVEYCNGSIETTYGMLRAQHGYSEPYNVKLWQIGNEVYGSYQIGHTYSTDYATRYIPYYNAMKAVDPNIKVVIMGRDPGYPTNDGNAWNRDIMNIAGPQIDYLDIHRYVRGFTSQTDLVNEWGLSDFDILTEYYVSFPYQYDLVIYSVRDAAERANADHVKLAVTEWSLSPFDHLSLPHVYSQANAIFYAGMLNTFIKNGDFAHIICSHDFSVFVSTYSFRNTPLLPRACVSKMYSGLQGKRVLEVNIECEKFDMIKDIPQMLTLKNVPLVDAVALTTANRNHITVFVVNRSQRKTYPTTIHFNVFKSKGYAYSTTFQPTGHPCAREKWGRPTTFSITENQVEIVDNKIQFTAPISSVSKFVLEGTTSIGLEERNNKIDLDLQAFPNPFNKETKIKYSLVKTSYVELRIFDIRGSLIATIFSSRQREGSHLISWNTAHLSSGIYFCEMNVKEIYGETSFTKILKLVYIP